MTIVPPRSASPESSAATRSRPIRVWLVEDEELYRRTLAEVIEATSDLVCPIAVGDCERAIAALATREPPDIMLMDLGLPGMGGIEGIRQLRRRLPRMQALVLTVHEEDDKVFAALCAGASGYLLKTSSSAEVLEAIRQLDAGAAPINSYIARKLLDRFAELATPPGDYGLTPREREILQRMVDGMIMKEIATDLGISYHTIDTHIRHIYGKLHVDTRSGAVAKAVRERLVR